jgi:hypothetical protein
VGKSIDAHGNPIFRHNKTYAGLPVGKAKRIRQDQYRDVTRTPERGKKVDINRYCVNTACGFTTQYWVDYFCPKCGTHHDQLYGSERDPRATMTREQIEAEYADAGYTFAPSGIDAAEVIKQMSVQNMKDTWEDRKQATPG